MPPSVHDRVASGSLFKRMKDAAEVRLFEAPHPWRGEDAPPELGPDFFKHLPREPGIYRFWDQRGNLLYVGKAKSLQARLLSYRRAKPASAPRKVIHLVRLTVRIDFEVCASEAQALLRENEALRTLKPPFNVQKTRPEGYGYAWLKWEDGRLSLRLDPRLESRQPGERVLGPYKGGFTAGEALLALVRLLWVVAGEGRDPDRFEIPQGLVRVKRGLAVNMACRDREAWLRPLTDYLSGRSLRIVRLLTQALLLQEGLPPFAYRMVQDDLDEVRSFYAWGPRATRRAREALKRAGRGPGRGPLPQGALDDGKVLAAFEPLI